MIITSKAKASQIKQLVLEFAKDYGVISSPASKNGVRQWLDKHIKIQNDESKRVS